VGLLVALMWVLIDWRPWWQRLRRRLGAGTLALIALAGLTAVKKHWRTTWGAASVTVARV
jgi:hypothetical protein